MFSAGRISYPALQERQRWKLRAFLERDKPTMCSLSFSLVPSNVTGLEGENEGVRGQWLIMTIKYTCEATFSAVDMNAVRFMFADSEGGDDLERPPNGHATEAALAACLRLIPELTDEVWRIAPFCFLPQFCTKTMVYPDRLGTNIGKDSPKKAFHTQVGAHLRRYAHDRKTQGGIRIVQFGQGLTEKIDDPVFQAAVEAVAPGVGLMRSASTYASEEAGGPIGGQQCAQQ